MYNNAFFFSLVFSSGRTIKKCTNNHGPITVATIDRNEAVGTILSKAAFPLMANPNAREHKSNNIAAVLCGLF